MKNLLSLSLLSSMVALSSAQVGVCFGDEQFFAPGDKKTQPASKQACLDIDGTLARIGNSAELNVLLSVIGALPDFSAWVGVEDPNDSAVAGTERFEFVDGNTDDLSFIHGADGVAPWSLGNPKADGGACVQAFQFAPQSFANADCGVEAAYVCRRACPPTASPTTSPTASPTFNPTTSPTKNPTKNPTTSPTKNPTKSPTFSPTKNPTTTPTQTPTKNPTKTPTKNPTESPTTGIPSTSPTPAPTAEDSDSLSATDTVIAGLIGISALVVLFLWIAIAVVAVTKRKNKNEGAPQEEVATA